MLKFYICFVVLPLRGDIGDPRGTHFWFHFGLIFGSGATPGPQGDPFVEGPVSESLFKAFWLSCSVSFFYDFLVSFRLNFGSHFGSILVLFFVCFDVITGSAYHAPVLFER